MDRLAVIGVPDAERGEVAHAFVCLVPGATVSSKALIAVRRESLATREYLEVLHIRAEALPVSGASRVLTSVLRERYVNRSDENAE